MPGEAVWVDVEAYHAETRRRAEAADYLRRLNDAEQRVPAAESDAEPRTCGVQDFIRVGLTYRQVDHWTARAWLRPDLQHPGSGLRRRWPIGELEVGRLMRRMTGVGVEPWAAHQAARAMVAGNGGAVRLGKGVWIEVR